MTVGARDEFHRGNAGCTWTLDARMRRATTSEGFSTVAARSAHRDHQRHFLTAAPSEVAPAPARNPAPKNHCPGRGSAGASQQRGANSWLAGCTTAVCHFLYVLSCGSFAR